MTTLLLSPTRKHFRIGDENDYVVLDGGRVIGRIFLQPQARAGRSVLVLDDNGFGHSTVNRQARLFSDARTSDG
jgi:hypothetical protein